jgi:hypothetical protein
MVVLMDNCVLCIVVSSQVCRDTSKSYFITLDWSILKRLFWDSDQVVDDRGYDSIYSQWLWGWEPWI